MIEAYIIDRLKREKEELEREVWQPIPLPLEEYDPRDRREPSETPEKREDFVVEIVLKEHQGASRGSRSSNGKLPLSL